jgi:hypothetical protein
MGNVGWSNDTTRKTATVGNLILTSAVRLCPVIIFALPANYDVAEINGA